MESGWKHNVEISPNCPRCGSSNTKFCYYNNYSLTQPRYFCKGCRRYWTKGGSLRNVPIGGGCRKTRRAKVLQIATYRVPSKSMAYEGAPNDHMGHSYAGTCGNPLVDSTSSSMTTDGSNIDLALVYANFLSQQPESETVFEMPELSSGFDPYFEFSRISDTNLDSNIQLPQENGLVGCLTLLDQSSETHLSDANQMHFCGFDSIHKQQERIQQFTSHDTSNYALSPLPGQEVASQEMLWSNSQAMVSNHSLQAMQLPGLKPEAQDQNLLIGDMSPFHLSSYETFFRP